MDEKQVAATSMQETTSDTADVIQATLWPPPPLSIKDETLMVLWAFAF
jgi:hypothetical protein